MITGYLPDGQKIIDTLAISKPETDDCSHMATITHSNGSKECLMCNKMLKEVKPKWRE